MLLTMDALKQTYTLTFNLHYLPNNKNEIPVLKSLDAGSLTFNDKYNSLMLLLLRAFSIKYFKKIDEM